MKKIIVVIVGIYFAIGLVSMMNTKPSPQAQAQAQVQVEEVPEDEPTQVMLKYHPSDSEEFPGLTVADELPKGLADQDELPLVNGKRPTVQGLRDSGLDQARKMVAKLSESHTAIKLDDHANVQPVTQREHMWKVYGWVDKANGHGETSPFLWIAFVSFDGEDVRKPYRLVELEFKY
jgi:hypothetical protein